MNRERTRLPLASDHNQRLQVEYRRVSELKIDAKTARQHSPRQIQQLANRIKAFRFNVPVLIDEDGNVIAGVARVLAAQMLGLEAIPTIRLSHLSRAQLKAFTIADNRLSELSEWNETILAEQLRELSLLDLEFDLEAIGFDTGEIDFRILSLEDEAENDSADVMPPLAEIAVSQLGDVWILGKHQITCGNALDSEAYRQVLKGDLAHAAIVDAPYNVRIDGNVSGLGMKTHREFPMASGEMTPDEFTGFLTAAFREIAQHSVAGSLHYYWMDWRHLHEALKAGTEAYDELMNLCVWAKTNAGMGSFYRSQHELVLVFKKASAHINNVQLGKYGRNRSNVWSYPGMNSFARSSDEGNLLHLHPTVKPVKLLADVILDCTKRNNIVLDSFLGSGSTLIAAEKTGRRCVGIELDALYVDTIIRRWQAYTGENAKHLDLQKTFEEVARERGLRHVP